MISYFYLHCNLLTCKYRFLPMPSLGWLHLSCYIYQTQSKALWTVNKLIKIKQINQNSLNTCWTGVTTIALSQVKYLSQYVVRRNEGYHSAVCNNGHSMMQYHFYWWTTLWCAGGVAISNRGSNPHFFTLYNDHNHLIQFSLNI